MKMLAGGRMLPPQLARGTNPNRARLHAVTMDSSAKAPHKNADRIGYRVTWSEKEFDAPPFNDIHNRPSIT
jgi:hypothetical protein